LLLVGCYLGLLEWTYILAQIYECLELMPKNKYVAAATATRV